MQKKVNLLGVVIMTSMFICCGHVLQAQDIITLKNGDEIQAKVLEIEDQTIKYKKFDNPSGPNYTLKKAEIFMIRYENGSKDVFNEIATSESADKQQQPIKYLSYDRGRVYQNAAKLKPVQIRSIMAVSSEAFQKYNSGRSLYIVGQVIAYPGYFVLGWGIGTLISGGENGVGFLVSGAAGILVGELISFSGNNKIKSSVQIYNLKVNNALSYQINFGLTQTGVGLSMRF